MDFFKKHDTVCLYGTNLHKNDVVTIISAWEQDQYVVDKVYKFTIFHRILEWFGKPFKYHNCVRLRKLTPAEEQKR